MKKIVNIAAYKFVALPDLRLRRARLLALCKSWELKGTILLSAEGINLFAAGAADKIDRLLAHIPQCDVENAAKDRPDEKDVEARNTACEYGSYNRHAEVQTIILFNLFPSVAYAGAGVNGPGLKLDICHKGVCEIFKKILTDYTSFANKNRSNQGMDLSDRAGWKHCKMRNYLIGFLGILSSIIAA